MASEDRRSDMGQKIMIGMILGAFGTIVGFFVNSMSTQALYGVKLGTENSIKIATLDSNYTNIQADLLEIKALLRRGVPNGNGGFDGR